MEYFLLCTLWIAWCFLHSFFTTSGTTNWFRNHLGERFRFYRFTYNIFSLMTVLPLLYWQGNIAGPVVIPLSPFLRYFKIIAIILTIAVMAAAFFSFDTREFLGIKQITGKAKGTTPTITKHGLYGFIRHPLYLGGFIFFLILTTDAPLAQFLGYLILALYMVIGTFREDRRLANELGDVYRQYQKEVPMFLSNLRRK
ncbi:MAG: isoprenylcysteine carboxylmethyltransferase family protein [Nitrospirae bacterium]|nr:isoprenylcysteine carboxylmethyltransferase family protein [Nitrospirota bacterium]